MEANNPYEQKYKQLNMLGKGNYGTTLPTQARSTKLDSTTANKAKKHPITSPKKCSCRECQNKTSKLPTDKYFKIEVDQNIGKTK